MAVVNGIRRKWVRLFFDMLAVKTFMAPMVDDVRADIHERRCRVV